MAYITLVMQYPRFEEVKKAPSGISWTSALLEPFFPLFRQYYMAAAI
jgi:hypothetical protein